MQLQTCLLTIAAMGSTFASTQGLEVDTSIGQIQGFIDPSLPDVKQWLGIPFAEPPIGPLRFLPPVAISEGQRNISAQKHQLLAYSITAFQSSATKHHSFWLLLLTTKIAFISMSSRPRIQVAVICQCCSGSMGVRRFRVGSTPRMSVLNNGFKERKSISLFKLSE